MSPLAHSDTPDVVLEPIAQSFIDTLAAAGGPPICTLSPQAARELLNQVQGGEVAMLPAEVEEHVIPGGPGGEISITVVRPPETVGVPPVVLYVHGGGWVIGNFGTHERLVRELATRAGASVVFVNYSPSPEAQFPTAIEEVFAAVAWVAARGAELGLDGRRLASAGDSVGGNMAAAVTILAKERGAQLQAPGALLSGDLGPPRQRLERSVCRWTVADPELHAMVLGPVGSRSVSARRSIGISPTG
jgi:acetyl esterase